MPSEIAFDAGIAKFKIDLTEFVLAFKDLLGAAVGASQREQVQDAIQAMIAEVRQTYDTVVDTLIPLYGLSSPQEFAEGFGRVLSSFKGVYLQRSDAARAHCHVVRQLFDTLQQRRSWMERAPLVNRGFTRLKKICDEWLLNDVDLSYQMTRFFENLNDYLDEVADLLQRDAAEAYRKMREGPKQTEANFREIRSQLAELDAIGRNF